MWRPDRPQPQQTCRFWSASALLCALCNPTGDDHPQPQDLATYSAVVFSSHVSDTKSLSGFVLLSGRADTMRQASGPVSA